MNILLAWTSAPDKPFDIKNVCVKHALHHSVYIDCTSSTTKQQLTLKCLRMNMWIAHYHELAFPVCNRAQERKKFAVF